MSGCLVEVISYPEPTVELVVQGEFDETINAYGETNIIKIMPGCGDIPVSDPLNFLVEFATDESAIGFVGRTEAENGIPGAPFGAITGGVNNYEPRELSWFQWGDITRFYFDITDGGNAPTPPFFTSLSFTDDNGKVWTLTDADSEVPGGRDTLFAGQSIQYWDWIFYETVIPAVTNHKWYRLTVVV